MVADPTVPFAIVKVRPVMPSWWRWALVGTCAAVVAAILGLLIGGRSDPARVGLVILSTVLATASTFPMIWETIHRLTAPRLVTWGTWALLTAMAGIASASRGDYPSAAFSLVGTVASGSVVIFALRFGDRRLETVDRVCLVLVAIGVALWLIFNQPAVAVIASCVIDFIGLWATGVDAWKTPDELPTTTFALIAAAGACAGLAAWGHWSVTALAYPVYVAVSMGTVAGLTLRGRRPSP